MTEVHVMIFWKNCNSCDEEIGWKLNAHNFLGRIAACHCMESFQVFPHHRRERSFTIKADRPLQLIILVVHRLQVCSWLSVLLYNRLMVWCIHLFLVFLLRWLSQLCICWECTVCMHVGGWVGGLVGRYTCMLTWVIQLNNCSLLLS